jgi:hypothetical protein
MNVMLPVVAEIIHVFKPFVRSEAKVRESDLIGIIGEADAALVSDTKALTVYQLKVVLHQDTSRNRAAGHGLGKLPLHQFIIHGKEDVARALLRFASGR